MIRRSDGFTVVELLVVIVVIAILATVSIGALGGFQERARNSQRLQDASVIVKALEMYKIQNGVYPHTEASNGSGWEISAMSPNTFLDRLTDSDILSRVPIDPQNFNDSTWPQRSYYYVHYGSGAEGCDSSRGRFYVFGIKDLENKPRPSLESPGWSCPNRNWGNEFDWVVGGFEK